VLICDDRLWRAVVWVAIPPGSRSASAKDTRKKSSIQNPVNGFDA
jgi:hypothetical protein